jgi:hypothetical protein
MAIQPGLYEQLITQALKKELGSLDNGLKSITSPVDPEESHDILASTSPVSWQGSKAVTSSQNRLPFAMS